VLHAKSDHSLGYGCVAPEALARTAAELGFSALALTDLETLSAQVRFHEACRAFGIHPISGVELRPGFVPPKGVGSKAGRVVLLAKDARGYENLCRIVTSRRANAPAGDIASALERHGAGLYVLSDDCRVLDALARRQLETAGLCALLIRPTASEACERALLNAAASHGLPVVASVDAVLAAPADHSLHVLVRAIALRRPIASLARGDCESALQNLTHWQLETFADQPQSIANAERIAETCRFDLLAWPRSLPAWRGNGVEPMQALRARCQAVAPTDPRYRERLDAELRTIASLELGSYFLVIHEILSELRRRDIAVCGRGSAVGSLVAHLLGVSDIDPVAHGLLFERFLHTVRSDLPDVDLDVPSDRREEVLSWVHNRFGSEHVAAIATLSTFQRRTAYREGLRALGASAVEIAHLMRELPDDSLDLEVPLQRFPTRLRRAAGLIEALVGRPQHLSVHPGGVIIAGCPLVERTALERAPKGVLVTQYDMHSIERLGLVKVDLLGNRCLSELEQIRRDTAAQPFSTIASDDPATLAAIDRADTLGCFQLETPAMRSLLKQVPIRSMTDVCAALALVRPGAASGRAKASYIRRAHREEAPPVTHPVVHELLKETHGLFLYEEDVVKVIAALSDVSLAEADRVRAAMVRGEDVRDGLTERWCKRGMNAVLADQIADEVLRFAAYSFSKAHALSYARLAYLSVYMKLHAPLEFACALLTHHAGIYPLRTLAAELVRSGVRFLRPSVNTSGVACQVAGSGVRIGLALVKHVTERTRRALLRDRTRHGPFRDLPNLLQRVRLASRELRALVLSGACDDLTPLSADNYPFAHDAVLRHIEQGTPLHELTSVPLPQAGPRRPEDLEDFEVYRRLVRVRNELEFMDMHLSGHPVGILRHEATRIGAIASSDLHACAGQRVRFVGLLSAMRRIRTAGGQIMQFVTLEDEHGLIEGVLSPAIFKRIGTLMRHPGPFLLVARVAIDRDELSLSIEEAAPFASRPRKDRTT
jgi:DNA-directed DNA polymerase III PolC